MCNGRDTFEQNQFVREFKFKPKCTRYMFVQDVKEVLHIQYAFNKKEDLRQIRCFLILLIKQQLCLSRQN